MLPKNESGFSSIVSSPVAGMSHTAHKAPRSRATTSSSFSPLISPSVSFASSSSVCSVLVEEESSSFEDSFRSSSTTMMQSSKHSMRAGSCPLTSRIVRFQPHDNLCRYHAGIVLEEPPIQDRTLWYSQADLVQMRRKALVVAKEADYYGVGSLLTNTYGKACAETVSCLNQWTQTSTPRRGLERWANEEYAAKRSDIRKRTIRSVLRAQHKLREEDTHEADYQWQVLARLSTAFSQDSTAFAQVMGEADFRAVQTDLVEPPNGQEQEASHADEQRDSVEEFSAPRRSSSGRVVRRNSPRSVLSHHHQQHHGPPRRPSLKSHEFVHYF